MEVTSNFRTQHLGWTEVQSKNYVSVLWDLTGVPAWLSEKWSHA